MNDDVETANLRLEAILVSLKASTVVATYEAELLLLQACVLNLLPDLRVASLAGALDGGLRLAKVDERRRETSPVRDRREQELGGLVQRVLETLLADNEDVRDVGKVQEVFHVVQTVGLGVGVCELCIDLGLAQGLARHLEVSNEIIVLACTACNLDDFSIVAGILGLDVRVYRLSQRCV